MSELSDYFAILRKRGFSTTFRELRSRFIRQSPKIAIRRVMDLCEKYNSVFTFYITGNTAMRNRDFIREIINRGHSIECHGFNHIRFDSKDETVIRNDLKAARQLYEKCFNHCVCGFRAPYLKLDSRAAGILKNERFAFSSSTLGNEWFEYDCGLTEIPISICDWHVLIKDNKSNDYMISKLLDSQEDGNVFELHPWRIGQKRYIEILEEFLKQKRTNCVSQKQLYEDKNNSIALTGDVGEFGLSEIFIRAFSKSDSNCKKFLD